MNVYIVLLICLVIFPPIVSNDRFLMEVSATSSEDGDGDGNGDGDGDGDEDRDRDGDEDENSNSETENESGSNGEDGEGADSDRTAAISDSHELGGNEGESNDLESRYLDSSGGLVDRPDLASPLTPADMAGPAAGITGSEESSSLNRDSESEGGDGDRFRHNAQEIAMEIASLSPEEIREYPITDLSDEDIILVFRFLNPDNLVKVLLNIPQETLVEIKDRLTPADFGEPLSRISETDRTQVANRLLLTSAE